MSMIADTMTHISHYLYQNPTLGMAFAFLMAFLESLAIVGSIIPGSITMTAVGLLIGSGILPFKLTVILTVLGALIGDYLSYYVGIHYKYSIRNWQWLKPYQHWLVQGADFFKRYGIASIIMGRFVGPMRSMMPMVAGILDMPPIQFAIAIFPSALLWSFFYLLPGILLGALSLEMPNGLASNFLSILLTAMLILLFVHGLYHHYRESVRHKYQHKIDYWASQFSHPCLPKSEYLKSFFHHLAMTSIATACFLLIAFAVTCCLWPKTINQPLYHFMQSIQLPWLNHVVLAVTLLADKHTLALFAGSVALFAFFKKNIRLALYIGFFTIFSAGVIYVFKLFFHIDRPDKVIDVLGHTSFPSGHTSYFTAFVFTIYLIHRFHRPYNTTRLRWPIISVIIIALTRLYCGAHWITDVMGGAAIGAALAHISMALYTWRPIQTWPKQLGIAMMVSLILAQSVIYTLHKDRNFRFFFSPPPIESISKQTWLSDKKPFEKRRRNRLHHATDYLNLHWACKTEAKMESTLQAENWQVEAHPEHWYNRIALMIQHPNMRFLSLLSRLHNNQEPAFIASKIEGKRLIVLEIWPTHHQLEPSKTALWIGSLYWYQIDSKEGEPFHFQRKKHYTVEALSTLTGSQIIADQLHITTK